MKTTGKLLTGVFLILFIVLLIELGYIYRSFTQPKQGSNQVVPTLTIDQTAEVKTGQTNENQAISEDIINAMAKANRGTLVTSTMHNVYQGTVAEYVADGDGIKIKIAGVNGFLNSFFYEADKLSKVSFFKKTGNTLPEPIKAADIKVGDLVRIEGDMDLLKPLKESFISDQITVIAK